MHAIIEITHFHFHSEILVSVFFFVCFYATSILSSAAAALINHVWLFSGCSVNAAEEPCLLVDSSWPPLFCFVFFFGASFVCLLVVVCFLFVLVFILQPSRTQN